MTSVNAGWQWQNVTYTVVNECPLTKLYDCGLQRLNLADYSALN